MENEIKRKSNGFMHEGCLKTRVKRVRDEGVN